MSWDVPTQRLPQQVEKQHPSKGERVVYPDCLPVSQEDWPDFANRCKSILLERGDYIEGDFSLP